MTSLAAKKKCSTAPAKLLAVHYSGSKCPVQRPGNSRRCRWGLTRRRGMAQAAFGPPSAAKVYIASDGQRPPVTNGLRGAFTALTEDRWRLVVSCTAFSTIRSTDRAIAVEGLRVPFIREPLNTVLPSAWICTRRKLAFRCCLVDAKSSLGRTHADLKVTSRLAEARSPQATPTSSRTAPGRSRVRDPVSKGRGGEGDNSCALSPSTVL